MNNKNLIIKKVANNILEFLIDPTLFPPERHIYFRPEEILDNSFYENAKKDSEKAYGNQRQNSDFYPNRPIREASLMERKTLIASLDVLSQNFNESDPMAKDLRTMAYAISKMSEEELKNRLIADVEAKKKPEMVKCPQCSGNVMKKTGFCVTCGKKISEMKKAADEKEAGKEKGPGKPDGTGPMKDDPRCPMNDDSKTAEVEVKDYWNKEAAEAVRRSLIAEIDESYGIKEKKEAKEEKKEAKEEEKKEAKEEEKKEAKEEEKKEAKEEEKKEAKEEEKKEAKEEEKKEATSEAKESCDDKKKEDKDAEVVNAKEKEIKVIVDPAEKQANSEQPLIDEKEANEVDTSLLTAASIFDGIEMSAGLTTLEDIGDLSDAEKSRLDQLF